MDIPPCFCMHAKSLQLCPTLGDPIYSPPGSSVHGILQARVLKWIAFPFSRWSSDPGIKPASLTSPALAGRFLTTSATWKVTYHVLSSFVPRLLDSGPKLCRLWATSSPTGTWSCLASSLGPAMTAPGTIGPDCSQLPCGACGSRVLCPGSSRHWGSTWLTSLAYNTPHLF